MTEQEGEHALAAPGLATGDLTAEEGLAGEACRLGRQHSSAAIAPFGDVEHVYWGEGAPACSARSASRPPPRRTTLPDGSAWSAPTATRSRTASRGTMVPAHDGIH